VDPPTVKQIHQAINTHMQTTHNQSRYQPARKRPPVQSGTRHVIPDDRCPAGNRTGQCRGQASRYATVTPGESNVTRRGETGELGRTRGVEEDGNATPPRRFPPHGAPWTGLPRARPPPLPSSLTPRRRTGRPTAGTRRWCDPGGAQPGVPQSEEGTSRGFHDVPLLFRQNLTIRYPVPA